MRILQINSVFATGSTGRIMESIHNLLIEEGHESYVAYGRGQEIIDDGKIKIGNNKNIYSHVLLTRIFDKHGFGSKKATKEFIDKIIDIRPDIIHLHNLHGYYINIKILFDFLKKYNKPIVWTFHDCWPITGHCTHFDFANCYKWKTCCFNCPEKKSYPSSNFVDNSTSNYLFKKELFTSIKNLTIVTPSKWLLNIVKDSFLKSYQIKVINNGIDLNKFHPRNSDFKQKNNLENKFIILGVANVWNDRKGFEYFIKLSKLINDDEVIVLVGLTKKQKASLPKNILGITRTQSVEELVEIYSAVDVFVNPSLEDTFPTTNLEALACGTPVITFNTGGSVESVSNDTGYIIEKGDINTLFSKISEIKRKGKKYYKQNCIKRAKEFYNSNDRYQEYVQLYKFLYYS